MNEYLEKQFRFEFIFECDFVRKCALINIPRPFHLLLINSLPPQSREKIFLFPMLFILSSTKNLLSRKKNINKLNCWLIIKVKGTSKGWKCWLKWKFSGKWINIAFKSLLIELNNAEFSWTMLNQAAELS